MWFPDTNKQSHGDRIGFEVLSLERALPVANALLLFRTCKKLFWINTLSFLVKTMQTLDTQKVAWYWAKEAKKKTKKNSIKLADQRLWPPFPSESNDMKMMEVKQRIHKRLVLKWVLMVLSLFLIFINTIAILPGSTTISTIIIGNLIFIAIITIIIVISLPSLSSPSFSSNFDHHYHMNSHKILRWCERSVEFTGSTGIAKSSFASILPEKVKSCFSYKTFLGIAIKFNMITIW